MFRALLCPSSGARDYDVDYHIGRFVLGLLYVGGWVRLGWSSVRAAVVIRTHGRLYIPGNIPGTHCWEAESSHSAAGRNMLMKNSNETIGNRNRDLTAFMAVSQLTASPRAPG